MLGQSMLNALKLQSLFGDMQSGFLLQVNMRNLFIKESYDPNRERYTKMMQYREVANATSFNSFLKFL